MDESSRSGKLPSFEVLYDRYGTRVQSLIYRMTGNLDVARDIAQDVWLEIYRHADAFEARADVFSWIYRIAVNRTLNHLKREKRRRWSSLLDRTVGDAWNDEEDESGVDLPSGADPHDRAVENEEIARLLWRAVQQLDPKYRVPIVLFHYEERSYSQVAELMGISMTAAQARIFRGRKQLARILGPLADQL